MYKIILYTEDNRIHTITFENKDIIKQFPDELHVDMSLMDISDLTMFLDRIKKEILYND